MEELLKLFNTFSELIERAFRNDTRFTSSRDKAYQEVVNDTTVFNINLPTCRASNKTTAESKCPELLALFCDQLLRNCPLSKRMTSLDTEKKLKEVVSV